jgi:Mn2+/Fe2+ NRAMP family transporter
MECKRRGQISTEYLIVVAFVVFLVIAILGVASFYVSGIRDQIRANQVSDYAGKLISNSESVFFAGELSKVTINAYLPSGVNSVSIVDQQLVIDFSTDAGPSVAAFSSDVPIQGIFSSSEGVKRFEVVASENLVTISEE